MSDQSPRWSAVSRYRRLLAVAIALLMTLVSWLGLYFVATTQQIPEGMKAFWLTLNALFTNLASTVIAFWVASTLFERENEQELKSIVHSAVGDALALPSNLQQVRWADLINNSSEIDFVVQGWNGWAEQAAIARALTDFFERGGAFRLYVCDPQSSGATQARAFLETRLARTPAAVIAEIEGTEGSIREAFDQASGAGKATARFEVHRMDRLNWYFAALFKGRGQVSEMRARDVFVFSVYSHTPRKPWLMPALVTYPDLHEGGLSWFEKELEHLRTKDQLQSATAPSTRGRRSIAR